MEKTWKNKSVICCGAKKSVNLEDTVISLELSWGWEEQAGRGQYKSAGVAPS